MLTTLRQILEGKNNVFIKEYVSYYDGLIFVGGCYYADKNLMSIDGSFFVLDLVINAYDWKDANTLMIVRERNDNW